MKDHLKVLLSMRRSGLQNYIVPGLLSSLVGGAEHGTVRLFEASREQLADITPHSHRFDFTCLVLQGTVANRIWRENEKGEPFVVSKLTYGGAPGTYTQQAAMTWTRWEYQQLRYSVGDWYSMTAEEIHSIAFSADAVVLFFEGPQRSNTTRIIEPVVGGQHLTTFKVEPWMFAPVSKL